MNLVLPYDSHGTSTLSRHRSDAIRLMG